MAAVLRTLDTAISDLADQHNARAIVLKEFSAEEAEPLDALQQYGYIRADSLPMHCFEPRFHSFEEYLQTRKSHARSNVRRSMRKFERAGLQTVRLTGEEQVGRLSTDDVQSLYEAVLDHARAVFERLPAGFIRELARRLGDRVVVTQVRQEESTVAFGCGLMSDSEFHMMFMGLDYEANREGDVYFNLLYRDLDFAMQQGVSKIYVGQNAPEFKTRLGCVQQPRFFYVKGRGWVKPVLQMFSGMLFPSVELIAPPVSLHDAARKRLPEIEMYQPAGQGR